MVHNFFCDTGNQQQQQQHVVFIKKEERATIITSYRSSPLLCYFVQTTHFIFKKNHIPWLTNSRWRSVRNTITRSNLLLSVIRVRESPVFYTSSWRVRWDLDLRNIRSEWSSVPEWLRSAEKRSNFRFGILRVRVFKTQSLQLNTYTW